MARLWTCRNSGQRPSVLGRIEAQDISRWVSLLEKQGRQRSIWGVVLYRRTCPEGIIDMIVSGCYDVVAEHFWLWCRTELDEW
jgi:hypothetical protein